MTLVTPRLEVCVAAADDLLEKLEEVAQSGECDYVGGVVNVLVYHLCGHFSGAGEHGPS